MPEPLDLKILDRMERSMPRQQGHVWIMQQDVDYIGDNLRPMLDLIGRLGRALESTDCSYRPGYMCRSLYPKNPGRWCARCRGLEYYLVAGGG